MSGLNETWQADPTKVTITISRRCQFGIVALLLAILNCDFSRLVRLHGLGAVILVWPILEAALFVCGILHVNVRRIFLSIVVALGHLRG